MSSRAGDRSERHVRSTHPEPSPVLAWHTRVSWRSRLLALLSVVLASVSGFAVTNPGKWSIRFSRERAAEMPPASTANGAIIEVGVGGDSARSVTVRICTTASLRNSTCPAHGDGASADGRDQSDRVTREPKSPPNKRDVDSSHASCIGCGSAGKGGREIKSIPHLRQNRSKLHSAPVAICRTQRTAFAPCPPI